MPDADDAIHALGGLFGLAPRLTDLMELSGQQYGLGYARGRVVWALRESGPVVMRAVADALGVTPRTLTGLIDALEADGWVVRKPHPTDRRATLLELTPTAERSCAEIDKLYQAFAGELFAGVNDRDVRTFLKVLTHVRDHLDAAAEKAETTAEKAQTTEVARP